ncbi:hypothetical protein [Martelella sp. HB161492]|uniref:hypothetical protein n=1 Tax=Martelella sp. HB161492 TaxID=2720726 RepID=UPI00158FA89B|nr:hypothetical protein [Martelella sp. HB161492]
MVPMKMPRYTFFRERKSGLSFFWACPSAFKKQGAPFGCVSLGHDLTQRELSESAGIWNARLDAWREERNPLARPALDRYATVEWLVNSYLRHDSFLQHVSEYSRPDYRRILDRLCDTEIKSAATGKPVRVGDMKLNTLAVSTAEKIYAQFVETGAARTSEKLVTYAKACWKRMWPHHPDLFRKDTPNPWEGVTLRRRQKKVKAHVTRQQVYAFTAGAIAQDRPELAAAAVLAFEFLMRPSSIGAGFAAWSGYRSESAPDKLVIGHRKTGQRAEHPLEYLDENGQPVLLYPDAEAVLATTPRRGMAIVCQRNGTLFGDGTRLSQDVRAIADKIGMPGFTLDAARHGGMTELEERGLTEGEGRALSKHKTGTAYRGYAKETEARMLSATKKRMEIFENSKKALKNKG